jgi:phage gp46-like protein
MPRIQSLYIDPETRDFEYENGELTTDATVQTSVLWRVALEYGSSISSPEAGSKVWQIRKATTTVPQQAIDYINQALEPLVNEEAITDVFVEAELSGQFILGWSVSYEDASAERVVIDFPAEYAAP